MSASPVEPGDILAGKYRVDRVLGVGGMGVVVAATHVELRELRAIKFMLEAQLGDVEAVERFLREARASSRLKSEYAARVHDVGRLDNGAPYMVMEHLAGADLGAVLERRGALPVHEAALFVLQASEALAEAHAAGIIHRDIKPENLFLTQSPGGTPCIKVLDFGISKVLGLGHRDLALTNDTAIMGSPLYMSPEQLKSSRDVDMRTDIWSLGVVLYQLVTGQLPFLADNFAELISLVIFGAIKPPSEVRRGLPTALDPVILRCLERDLDRRYPTVAELAEALLPFAPPAGAMLVERIQRVLVPDSSLRLGRSSFSSYDAPEPPPAISARSISELAATSRTEEAPAVEEAPAPVGPTRRSRYAAGTPPTNEQASAVDGTWRSVTPSVSMVVASRTPMLILSIAGALALLILAVGFVATRHPQAAAAPAETAAPARDTPVTPPAPRDPTAPTAGATAALPTASTPPSTPPSAPSVTPAPSVAPALAGPTASPKPAARPTASAGRLHPEEPVKAPPADSGDPFGRGRK